MATPLPLKAQLQQLPLLLLQLVHALWLLPSLNERSKYECLGSLITCQIRTTRQNTIMQHCCGGMALPVLYKVYALSGGTRAPGRHLEEYHDIPRESPRDIAVRNIQESMEDAIAYTEANPQRDTVLILRRSHKISWSLYGYDVLFLVILPLIWSLIPSFVPLSYISMPRRRSSLQRGLLA
jgi:hypothetical protein